MLPHPVCTPHPLRSVKLAAVSLLGLAMCAVPETKAGSIVSFTFTDDATSGISSGKTYTAKADPGSNAAGPALINGVQFDRGALSGTGADTIYTAPGVTYSIQAGGVGPLSFNAGNAFDLPSAPGSTGVGRLLTDMVFTSNAAGLGNVTLLTFGGLTAGQQYSVRLYYRAWDAATGRPSTFGFDEDGGGALGASAGTIDEDAGNVSDGIANVIGYDYTAVTDGLGGALPLVVSITATTANNSWHLYGMTNEVVPEPTSLALLAAGAVGLLGYRPRGNRVRS